MKGLTQRQQEILTYINQSIEGRGYPPTIREIGRHMEIRSTNGVNDHLKALERKGVLRRDDLKSRAMRPVSPASGPSTVPALRLVTDADSADAAPANSAEAARANSAIAWTNEMVEVKILGRVAAGAPILAEEQVEDCVRVDRFFLGSQREVFALRICGESMVDDGIFDGDYVFVQKSPTCENGQTVIAMVEGEATCKRFYHEGDRIRLQAANASFAPIYVHERDFRQSSILGRVVGIYRKM